MNVLTNALEAVSPKTGIITIRTRYLHDEHLAQIEISDNGPGIPLQQQQRIFQAFHTTKGQRGTGLGLAVTRKIIREHKGSIELQSQLGEGTTFILKLPSDHPTIDASETKLPTPQPRSELD